MKKAGTNKQKRLTDDYVSKKGIELAQGYEEPWISGEELEKRPEFVKSLKRIEQGDIDLFIVYLPNRIGRFKDRVVRAQITATFEKTQTSVYCVRSKRLYRWNSERDMTDLEKKLMESREENQDRGENIRDGHEQARLEGRFSGGGLPFGVVQQLPNVDYGIEHEFRIDPEKMHVVNEIFEKVGKGWGYCKVRNYLNSDLEQVVRLRGKYKVGKKAGKVKWWTDSGIWGIVWNDFYTDGVVRTNTTDQHNVDTGLRNLVPIELVEQARRESKIRRPSLGKPNSMKRDWLLHGLAKCGYCGSPLAVRSPVKRYKDTSKTYHYYHCRRAGRGDPNKPCSFRSTEAERLERKLWSRVLETLLQKDLKDKLMSQNFTMDKDTEETVKLLKMEEGRLEELSKELDRISFNYEKGYYEDRIPIYESRMEEVRVNIGECRENIIRYTEQLERPKEVEEAVKRAVEGLNKELKLLKKYIREPKPTEKFVEGVELLDSWVVFEHPNANKEEMKKIYDLKRRILQKFVDFSNSHAGISVKNDMEISLSLLFSSL
jgi:DNA invertase Pin-like site-specific DNA recombinase